MPAPACGSASGRHTRDPAHGARRCQLPAKGIEVAVDALIAKPIDCVELRARLETITLAKRHLPEEGTRRLEAENTILPQSRALAVLQHVITALGSTLNAREILRTACEALAAAPNVAEVAAGVVNEDGTGYSLAVGFSRDGAGDLAADAARALLPTPIASDGQRQALPVRTDSTVRQQEHLSTLSVPIILHDRIAGRLELRAVDQRGFGSSDLTLAETIASAVGGALHRARLYHELQGCARGLEELCPQRAAELPAQRLSDPFISDVCHELRTALSVATLISGNLDTLYERLSPKKRRRMIRDIREHLIALDAAIDSILELSRIDSEQYSMERAPLDLTRLARDEAERQAPLAQRKGQTLQVKGEALFVWGNEGQLRQVIRNLLNNAIKYTPAGGQITCEAVPPAAASAPEKQPRQAHQQGASRPCPAGVPPGPDQGAGGLSVAEPAAGWATLRVVDTGIGICDEDLPRLFERFYRVEAQTGVPGSGLGLSIARELVERHGGRLTVSSRPGEGSAFSVLLPPLQEPH